MNKTVLLDPVNHISRLITAAVIAMVWFHQLVLRPVRDLARWMKMLPWRCSFAPLSTTVFMRNESHWIVSRTSPKRRRARTFSSFSGKITTPNAVAIPKQALLSTATGFTGDLIKSNAGKRLTTPGTVTNRRKSGSAANAGRFFDRMNRIRVSDSF